VNASSGGRRGLLLAAAATAVLLVAGLALVVLGLRGPTGPPQPPAVAALPPTASASATAAGGPPPAGSPAPSRRTPAPRADAAVDLGPILPPSRPVRLDVPSIGVAAGDLLGLGTQPDGSLEVPKDFARAGWWTPGPTHGQFGPAVIAGHVDSKRGPAVFYRLGELRPGADVRVTRADGSVARFTVDRVARYPKDAFPTAQVYGNTTNRAELRLITCGGDFNRRTGHYVDNVVAFAHLVG
jgi:Sortase domain